MVYIESHNIITSLGWNTSQNMENILNEVSGVKACNDKSLSDDVFPVSKIDNNILAEKLSDIVNPSDYTRLEQLAIISIKDSLQTSKIDIKDSRTLLILSTTKGNIDHLDEDNADKFPADRLKLWKVAEVIAEYYNMSTKPQIVSNACISGVAAMVLAKRMIDAGTYDNAVVVGVDVLSKFVVSGFQSFKSLSSIPCRPFDKNRDGLSLGEGVASVILTNNAELISGDKIEIVNGSMTNDANHISGPSRTAEGLYLAIQNTLKDGDTVDFISAHGTATPYNDDMESVAVSRAGLQNVPVNSLKGYLGHTLGAAGVIETIISIEALKRNMLIKTLGFKDFGVVEQITISDKTESKQLKTLLKLASGFGGSNVAAYFKKHD